MILMKVHFLKKHKIKNDSFPITNFHWKKKSFLILLAAVSYFDVE